MVVSCIHESWEPKSHPLIPHKDALHTNSYTVLHFLVICSGAGWWLVKNTSLKYLPRAPWDCITGTEYLYRSQPLGIVKGHLLKMFFSPVIQEITADYFNNSIESTLIHYKHSFADFVVNISFFSLSSNLTIPVYLVSECLKNTAKREDTNNITPVLLETKLYC